MKICILTPRYPFPENGGDVLRINGIAKYLKKKGHKLILVSFINKQQKISESDYLIYDKIITIKFNKFVSLVYSFLFFVKGKTIQCGFYYSPKFLKTFRLISKQEKPDLYISHLCRMETYLSKLKFENKSIIEMTDALSKTYALSTQKKGLSLKEIIYSFERKPISRLEDKIIKRYPKVVLVSENDINYLGNKKSLAFHTNGINLYNNRSAYNTKKICFVGNMRTLQNQDAVISFLMNVFPGIKKQNPEAEFHIVGAQPPESIMKLDDTKNIFVTGFVDSVEKYIEDACMLVAPVNIAAGIQNKVLIGMACKIPVVLTSLISGAIPGLISGKNCFIEDDFNLFCERCLLLMKNNEIRNEIASNGYEFVKANYSWEKKLEGYEMLYNE